MSSETDKQAATDSTVIPVVNPDTSPSGYPIASQGGYYPGTPSRLTTDEFKDQQKFFFDQVERFKKLFEDSALAKYIIMAGVTGVVLAVLELIRIIWLAARYIWKF